MYVTLSKSHKAPYHQIYLIVPMRELEPPFQLQINGLTVSVTEHSLSGTRMFHLEFSDKRKPLNITVAEKRPTEEKFWTSVPQGRQPKQNNSAN